MVTIDSLWEVASALFDGTIADLATDLRPLPKSQTILRLTV